MLAARSRSASGNDQAAMCPASTISSVGSWSLCLFVESYTDVYFVSGSMLFVWVFICICMGWGISGSVLRPRLGPPCSSALVALQMITCAHNIAAQAEPQSVIDVSCAQASKQTFSSKADVKLCATNALILVHDAVFSMRMILEAEKPLSNVPSAPWPFLWHK